MFGFFHLMNQIDQLTIFLKEIETLKSCPFTFPDLFLLLSHSVVSNSLPPHGLQHTRLLCPPLSPRVCSNPCPLSWLCCLTILFSAAPFSSRLQSFPASGSFPVSHLFTSGGQSIGASASALFLPMNIQG